MINAIIFDMDGLMFDTERVYSLVHSAMWARRGKEFTREVKMSLMGKKAEEVIRITLEYWKTNEEIPDVLKEQDLELVKIYRESVEMMPGLEALLSFLREKNIRTCIGTSSRRFLVDILLEKHNLTNLFEFVISGDVVTKGKPDPEIYNKCVKKLGVRPAECLVLEDSLNGILAGRSAGCMTCAIPSEYTKHEDFSIADLSFNSLSGVLLKIMSEK